MYFDGLWIDDNEVTGECNGECPDYPNVTTVGDCGLGDDQTNNGWFSSYNSQDEVNTYKLPFIPGNKWNLDNMTASLNATGPSASIK